jgi:hypothetical protein
MLVYQRVCPKNVWSENDVAPNLHLFEWKNDSSAD